MGGVVLSVLIVDDHPGFRAMARALLEDEGCRVLATVGDGRSAIAAAHALRPDVVLVDVGLPDIDGFTVARALPGHAVVLCSSRAEDDYPGLVEQCGACGFVPKSELSAAGLITLVAGLPGDT